MATPLVELGRQPQRLPDVRVYGKEHITSDGKFLEIKLNDRLFPLILTNVGGNETPAYIAWLDTHPPDENHKNVDPELPHASAVERARLIQQLDSAENPIKTVVTPASSKSIPSIKETVEIASVLLNKPLAFIVLPGGKDKSAIEKASCISPIAYRNVTSPENDKYIGISKEDRELLDTLNPHGEGIITVDDVYTTGGTDYGIQNVLNYVFNLPEDTRHPLVVLATESAFGEGYPKQAPSHVYSIIHLPEFIGGLPQK
jgi:hypothetical protein